MFRKATAALALALATAFAVPAFADTSRAPVAARHEEGKGEKAEKKFPMPAAEFKAHVAKKQEKIRARVEKHIEKKQLPKDKADEVRAQLNEKLARVNAKVDEVAADGTVTKEEAKDVHALVKELFPHHGKHHEKKGQPVLPSRRRQMEIA